MWRVNRILYDMPENDPYNETALKESYLRHHYCPVKNPGKYS
jgi:hypothetical protein